MMILCKTRTRSSKSLHNFGKTLTSSRYDFEYEDGDDEETGDVGIENKYYNAKQMKVDNPEEAIEEFLGMPALEEEKGDWYASRTQISWHEGLNAS
jgi:hypothetical protein